MTTPGLDIRGELTQAERDHIEAFYEVEVDFSRSMEEMVAAGHYDLDIIKKCNLYRHILGGPGSGKKLVEIGLLRHLGAIESNDLKELIKQLWLFNELLAQEAGYRYRFASAAEALALGAARPKLQQSQTLATGAAVLTWNHTNYSQPPHISRYGLFLLGEENGERAVTVADMAIGTANDFRLLIVKESEADSFSSRIIADAILGDEIFSKYLVSSHDLPVSDLALSEMIADAGSRMITDAELEIEKAVNYECVDPNITAANFPDAGGVKAVRVDLLDFKRYFQNAEEIVDALAAVNDWLAGQGVSRRYRPMNIRELLSLQASQPDLQRKYFIAALGNTWVDAEGKKKYPFLGYVDTDTIKGRCLIACRLKNILLNSFDNDLGSDWLFGIVCEEAAA